MQGGKLPWQVPALQRSRLIKRADLLFQQRQEVHRIEDRKRRLEDGLKRLATAARTGTLPGGVIEDGTLRVERLDADVPEEASDLVLDLYRRLPEARITDILMEVDDATGFTEAFTHLHTGAPCRDKVGLLNVVLAEGLNLGLSKMAGATSTHDFMQLSRLSRWHVESEGMARALGMVIEAQARLPMSQFWGAGQTASSDGQFFPTTRQGEAMNLIKRKIWTRAWAESLHPCVRSVCALRHAGHPRHGERSALHPGRAAHE